MRLKTYHAAPPAPTGYPLYDEFAVVMPHATENLITNPSFERATTGYTALNGAIARSAAQQRRGVYSLLVTPSSALQAGGVYYDLDLTGGQIYTLSVDILGVANVDYGFFLTDTSGTILSILPGMWKGIFSTLTYSETIIVDDDVQAQKRFKGCGGWQRQHFTFAPPSSGTWRLYLVKTSTNSVGAFYTDGWQVEALAFPTTYADGDMRGYLRNELAYYWTGAPHASTSIRSATTRSGGQVMSFKSLGFVLLAYMGLGMGLVSNRSVAVASGGNIYQGTVENSREFSIAGRFDASNFAALQERERELARLFNFMSTPDSQPLLMHYTPHDQCGPLTCSPLEIKAVYSGGLEGATTNLHNITSTINFTGFDSPSIVDPGNAAAELEYVTAISSTYGMIERYTGVDWRNPSAGAATNGDVLDAVYSNGILYVVGGFTTINGVAANYVAKWDGTAWTPLGSGLNNSASAIAADGMGNFYVGGKFTTAGGGAANRIAKWNGSTWTALGTGMDDDINAIALDGLGNLYAGGRFTTAGGGAASRIAKWNGSAWSALGTGTSGTVNTIVVAPNGVNVYVGGFFTSAGGNPAARVAKWDGSAWSALGQGIDGAGVEDMTFGPDGYLYVVGSFAGPFGITSSGIAKWNGTGWSGFGSGLTNTFGTAVATDITIQPDGVIYVGGSFDTANGIPILDGLARWTGSTWTPMDIDLPFSSPADTVYTLRFGYPNKLFITYDETGTVQVSGLTTVTNNGTAAVSPYKVEFVGPGRLIQLRNAITGKAIYFNITLANGERAVLNLTNGSFVSDLRGNIGWAILPGSQVTTWKLVEGDNIVETFITGTVGLDTKVTMEWRHGFFSLSDGTAR